MNPSKHRFRPITLLTGAGVVACALAVYYRTLAPGLTFIDSGELAAVCFRLGIAHPTGYPLYTLLGWFFTHAVPGRPIWLLNLLSSLLSCLCLLTCFAFLTELFLNTGQHKARQSLVSHPPSLPGVVSLASGVLLLAFSKVFWSVALITEVYALQGFFCSLLLLLTIRAARPEGKPRFRRSALLFFVLGLSFCNHMSTVLIIPALLYYMYSTRIPHTLGWKKWLLTSCFFFLGLAVYAYLPLRAVHSPVLNWGNPHTWQTFFWHVSAKQYRVWMFSSPDVMLRQLQFFVQLMLTSFGYIPLLLIPFGMWHLYHANRPVCWFLLIFFVTDIVYSINYDIVDIDAYFLPAFIISSLWMGSAVYFLAGLLWSKKAFLCTCTIPVLWSLFFIPLVFHYRTIDQSKNNLVEQYTKNIVRTAEQNAIVLSYQWDYFCSPFYYLQQAEDLRTDLIMIEVKLLKRSWYLAQLKNSYPALMEKSHNALVRFARELDKFEHGRAYDAREIQAAYSALINSFIRENIADRAVYITCEMEKEIGAGFQRVPEGLVFRLYPPKQLYRRFDTSQLDLPQKSDFLPHNRYHEALKSFYSFMLAARGIYEIQFGNRQKAHTLLSTAQVISPRHPLVLKGLKALEGTL